MAYQKLQVSRAIAVIPSDDVDIPNPAAEMLSGTADFSVAGTLTDVGTTFTTLGIEPGSIIYNTGASIAYYVTAVVSDTELSITPSSAGGATDAYKVYSGGKNNGCVLYVGATGDVPVIMAGGDEVTYIGAPTGMFMPTQVTRVKSSGLGASSILGLW
tara:strand:- start:1566 stop:2039 length:474 start_codon:yes stop_codon:yes gene_type:complete